MAAPANAHIEDLDNLFLSFVCQKDKFVDFATISFSHSSLGPIFNSEQEKVKDLSTLPGLIS